VRFDATCRYLFLEEPGDSFAVHVLVDFRDFRDPAPPLSVLQLNHLVVGPMKVIGNEGYLLIHPVKGVA
jgi:hypothetical protein